MSVEEQLAAQVFNQNSEKTFISKVLGEKDSERLRQLVKKQNLTREDMLEMLYLLSGVNSKLLNFGAWDRYIILKYFVWVREIVKISELFFDYEDEMNKLESEKRLLLTPETKRLIKNSKIQLEHSIKFLVDLYLNISNTTVSLGMSGLQELVRNRFEFAYPTSPDSEQKNKGFRILGRGGNQNGN